MSVHNNLEQTHVPRIKDHARTRWAQRTPADRPLEIAWRQAKPVDAPAADCEYARLYEPYNALLIVRGGRLWSVLINDGRLEKDGLVLCDECDDLVDPLTDDECPWCGASQPSVQTHGRVTVVRGGGQ
jgi:hypothetical protein